MCLHVTVNDIDDTEIKPLLAGPHNQNKVLQLSRGCPVIVKKTKMFLNYFSFFKKGTNSHEGKPEPFTKLGLI